MSQRLVWIFAAVLLLVIGVANVHLVYVAVSSQPQCVPHLKSNNNNVAGEYLAAKSAC